MVKEKTIQEKIKDWEVADLPEGLRLEFANASQAQLEDAFYQDLNFGTAGMRGLLGVGSNRMNIYTVAQTTEALARHMEKQGDDAKKRGVVISGDSRINSELFKKVSAEVLRAHDITVYLFNGPHPTPELSFAVMNLHTYAGIMITASHNTKEYNGYKLYGEDGGQLPPKPADEIVAERAGVTDIFHIKQVAGGIKKIGADMDKAYLEHVKTVTINPELIKKWGDKLTISFTPLHGAGGDLGSRALKQAGFNKVSIVKEQFKPDGTFPTVKYPNPEFHEVFKLSEGYQTDLELAVDPDSDRMGVGYRKADGSYAYLTGNQIAALMVNYILTAQQQAGTLPKNGAIVTSNVSSNLPGLIADSFGIKQFTVLTGFKYIADKIVEFDAKQDYQFEFGFEESYGFLIKPFVHDKDAVQAITLMSELAAYYKDRGMTIGDGLDEIYAKFSAFAESSEATEFPGEQGQAQMAAVMTRFRNQGPKNFGEVAVKTVEDNELRVSKDLTTGASKRISLPKANVIKYWLVDGSWIALRPSGTEPKLKVYIAAKGEDMAAANKQLTYLKDQINQLLK
ncbi:phospho-sugar mutase [Oenococcus kitaharae]|uniref:phospho-sugar mutase n=1 Tax=Oenococcus TaxID=46254 RepID=UPI0021E90A4A|nr:phospho-sugar mutase [Oenococcus kitaharae]MCV3296906.1 phospho-sugar mutase [Oenococcus kitaharae]